MAPLYPSSTGGGALASDPSIGRTPDQTPSVAPDGCTELIDQRTERSRTYANVDGSFTTEISQGRLNYKDAKGAWQPVDLDLIYDSTDPTGVYGVRVAANDVKVRFGSSTADAALASLTDRSGKYTISVRALGYGVGWLNPSRNRVQFQGSGHAATITAQPTDVGFEFGATLPDAQANPNLVFALDTGGLQGSLAADGRTIELRSPTSDGSAGALVGLVEAPTMLDGSGVPADPATVAVDLIPRGDSAAPASLRSGEVFVRYRIDQKWLTDASRQFPVTFDPTVCVLGHGITSCPGATGDSLDTFLMSAYPNGSPSGWTSIRVGYESRGYGYGTLRSLVGFSGLLEDGAQVTSASLTMIISGRYGNAAGQTVYAYPATASWGLSSTWNQMASKYDSGAGVSLTVPSDTATMEFSVTDIVRSWYTYNTAARKSNYGVLLKMANEGSSYGEVDFYRYTDSTTSRRPKLTINYVVPKVRFDFDPALGPTYAPSQMLVGQTLKLPVVLTNNSTDDWASSGSDYYKIGYMWFDDDGELDRVAQPLPEQIDHETSATVPLSIANGTQIPTQLTLRLDLVHVVGTAQLWASDWAKPTLYYSRDKRVLTTDSTRWTGSSVVDRAEFGISIVRGAGNGQGETRTVATGDGGTLGIGLASGNLSFSADSGLGFSDLMPVGLGYGYNSIAAAKDCDPNAAKGILNACGWYTNYDEGFDIWNDTEAHAGIYMYQDPSGNRYRVVANGGQLVGGGTAQLHKVRSTIVDENRPSDYPDGLVPASGEPFDTAFSGDYVLETPSNASTYIGAVNNVDLATYPRAAFAVRTTSAPSAGVAFKIYDVEREAYAWFVYTVGTDWSTGYKQKALNGAIIGAWAYYSRNLLTDLTADLPTGWSASDDFQVTNASVLSRSQSYNESTYLDAWRLESAGTTLIADANPAWSANGSGTGTSSDALLGTYSVSVPANPYSSSPDCTGSCFSGGSTLDLSSKPFAHWWWKKAGGSTVAVTFHVKNTRSTSATCGTGCDLTYYAGSAAPVGSDNGTTSRALQVSTVTPDDWSSVTRNVLGDARQVFQLYNDAAGGAADPVSMTGYRLTGADGHHALYDDLAMTAIPAIGNTDRWGRAGEYGLPSTPGSGVFTYDFQAEYADGTTHYFNADGLLTRITDRDGNPVNLDWDLVGEDAGQGGYALAAVRAPSDGGSYERQLVVSNGSGSVTFTEDLGTTSASTSSRAAVFYNSGGTLPTLTKVSPARNATHICDGRPSGCLEFSYGASQSLNWVADPRWDGSTSGPTDYRFQISWENQGLNGKATAITDKSHGEALLKVLSWDNAPTGSLYRMPLLQTASEAAANYAEYVTLTPDGSALRSHAPQACSGDNCATWPSATAAADFVSSTSMYDGLRHATSTYSYRLDEAMTDGPQVSVSRRGSNSSARVDNYSDVLAANEVAWTQSGDQYFASMKDSGGTNPDLYRTTYAYNGLHQLADTITPVPNPNLDYVNLVKTEPGAAGYWRLDDVGVGVTTADDEMDAHNGTYQGGYTLGQTGPLYPADGGVAFNGSTGKVDLGTELPAQYALTLEAWIKPESDWMAYAPIIDKSSITGKQYRLQRYGSTSELEFYDGTNVTHGGTLHTGVWNYVAAVVDHGATTLYIDGNPVARGAALNPLNSGQSSAAVSIATTSATTPQWFKGAISEAAISTSAATAGDIRTRYLAGRQASESHSRSTYDKEGHVISTDAQLVVNGGFEFGQDGWRVVQGTPNTEGTGHSPAYRALKLGQSASVSQDLLLVPGQTFRMQFWDMIGTGASASWTVKYWNPATDDWAPLMSDSSAATSWIGKAWDLTVPIESDGRIRLTLSNAGSPNSYAYFDDVVAVTGWSQVSYRADGLPTDVWVLKPAAYSSGSIPLLTTHVTYTAGSDYPAIFATSSTANYVSGGGSTADQNVLTQTVYDTWGRTLSTIDPDGIESPTSSYSPSGNQTYLDSSTDVFDNATLYTYDEVGNVETIELPLGETTENEYDLLNHVTESTGADDTVTVTVYDNWGQATASFVNWEDGTPSGASGLDDVKTTYTRDALGRVIETYADTGYGGALNARSASTYDLFGNAITSTVYATADTGSARTTTNHFETHPTTIDGVSYTLTRAMLTATQAPIAGAAACPDDSGNHCNSVVTLDFAGRAIATTDTYGNVNTVEYGLSGRTVRTIVNKDGEGTNNDADLVTLTVYDLAGRPLETIDPAGMKATSVYDNLGRSIVATSWDTATPTHHGIDVKTVYLPSGRVDRVSSVEATGTADAERAWTKTLYDTAGRAYKTLAHYDISDNAQLQITAFESGTEDGVSGSANWAVGAAGSVQATLGTTTTGTANSGFGSLGVTTTATAGSGVSLALSGTFKTGHH